MADSILEQYNLIYLASPYSHPDPAVTEHRYEQAVLAAAVLFNQGHLVFSPIASSHAMAKNYPELVGGSWDTWKRLDLALVYKADELWVLCIDGWRESVGVQAEIRAAKGFGRKIKAVLPNDLQRGDITILEGEPK